MNGIFYLIILVFGCTVSSSAQQIRFTVQFKDKQGSAYSVNQPAAFLSERSIQRRIKQNIPIDSTDLPVSRVYLDSLKKISGVKIINTSKWLNNALIEVADSALLQQLEPIHFINHLEAVGYRKLPDNKTAINKNIGKEKQVADAPKSSPWIFSSNQMLDDAAEYGLNYPQVHIHEGEYLHKKGFRGQGIIIAMIDAGFMAYKTNHAFDSLRANNQIQAEHDFVNDEDDVNNDDLHGANCLSILAANLPGQMLGTAPKASYYLFKTEDTHAEKPEEEQYWAVAAERADSAGADMISSSLGYSNFDDTTLNLTYIKRDGRTAPITIAANMAFNKGMIVCSSSGNSGTLTNDFKYVMCPADGDHVMAVGSVGTDGIIAPSSSGGPNGAGKLKPNIVSVGYNAVYVNIFGNISTGSGTSYSNPNVAGLIACLWQAFSEFSNAEIMDAVEKSASRYNNPDMRYGYGIPNMRIAYQLLDAKRNTRDNLSKKNTFINVYPVPFRQSFNIFLKAPATGSANLRVLDEKGSLLQLMPVQLQKNLYYTFTMSPAVSSSGIYYLQYDDGQNKTTVKLMHL